MDEKIVLSKFSEEEKTTLKTIDEFNKALVENDLKKYFSFIDEDFTTFLSNSPYRIDGVYDDDEELQNMYRTKQFTLFEEMQPAVQLFGDCAVVTYHVRAIVESKEGGTTLYMKETDVLVKKSGTWKVVHVHISETK